MNFFSKLKWILGIGMIFLVVVMTNLVDRQNFRIISNSIRTIYADRLVAQQILFDISSALHEKELLFKAGNAETSAAKQEQLNVSIREELSEFATTELTPTEQQIFNGLRRQVSNIENLEAEGIEASESEQLAYLFQEVKASLSELSAIQLKEGRREKFESQRAMTYINLFTQVEIAVLIIIAILIQVIVLYNPKSGNS